jgi:membrane protein required for colicin V production
MDTLILIVLLIGALVGFYQGAFKMVANFVGVALGLIVACLLYQQFGDYLADKSGASTSVGHVFAFVIIVILVPIVLGWIASLMTKAFSAMNIGFINRLCGAIVGVFCYSMLLSVAFNFLDFLESSAGYSPEKLEERPNTYYIVKHVAQPIVPDVLIVTDSVEEANGEKPMRGLKTSVNKVVDDTVDRIMGD